MTHNHKRAHFTIYQMQRSAPTGTMAILYLMRMERLFIHQKATNSTSSFKVQISISDLNIRKGPGTNYATTGKFTGKGVFTIVETKQGTGSAKGWGKLKSGAGWIALDYATRI